MKSDPGKGSSLHDHQTIEVFLPLTGRWAIGLGDDGEHEIILEPFDIFSVPPGVMRSVRNAGTEPGFIVAIPGRHGTGRQVRWSKHINEKAKVLGLVVNDDGDLVHL